MSRFEEIRRRLEALGDEPGGVHVVNVGDGADFNRLIEAALRRRQPPPGATAPVKPDGPSAEELEAARLEAERREANSRAWAEREAREEAKIAPYRGYGATTTQYRRWEPDESFFGP